MRKNLLFILFPCLLMFFSIDKAYADTYLDLGGNTDSCGKVVITPPKESPTCSGATFGTNECPNPLPGTSGGNSYSSTFTVSSNDGAPHTITYVIDTSVCSNAYACEIGNGGDCDDNAQANQYTASVPKTVTMSANSLYAGQVCGSYQLDWYLTAVDGNTSCTYGNWNNFQPGINALCETGITCNASAPPPPPTPTPTPVPNCTTTPTNCSACAAPANTCSNGNGTQTCTLSQPQTCNNVVATRACTLNNCSGGNICVNQACTPPTYTISGNIFSDLNRNGKQEAGENNYSVAPSISTSRGTVASNPNGTYTISGLTAGATTVSYNSLPAGYVMTSPVNGPPPSYAITVGNNCTTNGAPWATCTNGNITNLNFGITNLHPWWQSSCADVRENPIFDLLPAGVSALVGTASCSNTPGLIYTGDTNANFGQGQDSSSNQLVGGASYPEVYSPKSSVLATSYSSLLAKAQNANITPTALSSVCTITNCTLPVTLAHGIYLANGDTTLNAFTFPANQNYVILVNGNLTIKGAISVPVGSTALLATSGNITVASTVGAPAAVTIPTVSGWYVAGQSFVLPTQGNCTDLRLNIAGSVVINAQGGGGSFQNSRDLCGNDQNDPTVSFTQRLDMILNAPQFLEQQQTVSQEVAP